MSSSSSYSHFGSESLFTVLRYAFTDKSGNVTFTRYIVNYGIPVVILLCGLLLPIFTVSKGRFQRFPSWLAIQCNRRGIHSNPTRNACTASLRTIFLWIQIIVYLLILVVTILILVWGITTAIAIQPEVLGVGILTLIPAGIGIVCGLYLLRLRGFSPNYPILPSLLSSLHHVPSSSVVSPSSVSSSASSSSSSLFGTRSPFTILTSVTKSIGSLLSPLLPTTDGPLLTLFFSLACVTAYEFSVIFTGIGAIQTTILTNSSNNNVIIGTSVHYTTEYSYIATSWLFLTLNCLAMIGVVHSLLQVPSRLQSQAIIALGIQWKTVRSQYIEPNSTTNTDDSNTRKAPLAHVSASIDSAVPVIHSTLTTNPQRMVQGPLVYSYLHGDLDDEDDVEFLEDATDHGLVTVSPTEEYEAMLDDRISKGSSTARLQRYCCYPCRHRFGFTPRMYKVVQWYLLALLILAIYMITNYVLTDNEHPEKGRYLGFTTSGTVILMDIVILLMHAGRLLATPGMVTLIMAGGRIGLIAYGTNYWLLGQSTVYTLFGIYLAHESIDQYFARRKDNVTDIHVPVPTASTVSSSYLQSWFRSWTKRSSSSSSSRTALTNLLLSPAGLLTFVTVIFGGFMIGLAFAMTAYPNFLPNPLVKTIQSEVPQFAFCIGGVCLVIVWTLIEITYRIWRANKRNFSIHRNDNSKLSWLDRHIGSLWVIFTWLIIAVCAGILYHFTRSHIILGFGVFWPPLIMGLMSLYGQWVSDDFALWVTVPSSSSSSSSSGGSAIAIINATAVSTPATGSASSTPSLTCGTRLRSFAARIGWRNAFFVLRSLWIIALLTGFGVYLGLTVAPWYIGWLLAIGTGILIATVIPIISWFNTLEFRWGQLFFTSLAIGLHIALHVAMWIAYRTATGNTASDSDTYATLGLVFSFILYPSFVFLATGLYKLWDDKWKFTRTSALCIGLSQIIIIAFICASVAVFGDVTIPAAILGAYLFLSFVIAILIVWAINDFFLPRVWGIMAFGILVSIVFGGLGLALWEYFVNQRGDRCIAWLSLGYWTTIVTLLGIGSTAIRSSGGYASTLAPNGSSSNGTTILKAASSITEVGENIVSNALRAVTHRSLPSVSNSKEEEATGTTGSTSTATVTIPVANHDKESIVQSYETVLRNIPPKDLINMSTSINSTASLAGRAVLASASKPGSKSSANPKNSGLAPDASLHARMYFGRLLFPIFKFDPVRGTVRSANRGTILILIGAGLAFIWGFAAIVFITPTYAGVMVTNVTKLLLALFISDAVTRTQAEFSQALDLLVSVEPSLDTGASVASSSLPPSPSVINSNPALRLLRGRIHLLDTVADCITLAITSINQSTTMKISMDTISNNSGTTDNATVSNVNDNASSRPKSASPSPSTPTTISYYTLFMQTPIRLRMQSIETQLSRLLYSSLGYGLFPCFRRCLRVNGRQNNKVVSSTENSVTGSSTVTSSSASSTTPTAVTNPMVPKETTGNVSSLSSTTLPELHYSSLASVTNILTQWDSRKTFIHANDCSSLYVSPIMTIPSTLPTGQASSVLSTPSVTDLSDLQRMQIFAQLSTELSSLDNVLATVAQNEAYLSVNVMHNIIQAGTAAQAINQARWYAFLSWTSQPNQLPLLQSLNLADFAVYLGILTSVDTAISATITANLQYPLPPFQALSSRTRLMDWWKVTLGYEQGEHLAVSLTIAESAFTLFNNQVQIEMMRRRAEEEAAARRRAEEDERRRQEEAEAERNRLRKLEEEAAARRRADEEAEQARKQAEEEALAAKRRAEEEAVAAQRRAEEEALAAKRRAEEEEAIAARKRAQEEEARRIAAAIALLDEQRRRQAEEEEAKRIAAQRAKDEEDARQRAIAAAAEAEIYRKRMLAEAEARRRAQAEAEENAKRKAQADADARRKAQMEAEEVAKRKAEEEAAAAQRALDAQRTLATTKGTDYDKQHFSNVAAKINTMIQACRKEGKVYRDPDFQGSTSLGIRSRGRTFQNVQFERFPTINKESKIIEGGFDPSDIQQGSLGDCWLLSAFAVLAAHPEYIDNVLVTKDTNDAGVYAVRLWKNGTWHEVIVDDEVVVYSDRYKEKSSGNVWGGDYREARNERVPVPAFVHGKNEKEWWMAILEKAYAKYYGSYAAIEGGVVHEGLCSFVRGSVGGHIDLTSAASKAEILSGALFHKVKKYADIGYLLGAGSPTGSDTDVSSYGIVQGHAYSLLQVVEESDSEGKYQLVQLRNPWGKSEWNGAWSDSDKKSWRMRMRKKLNYDPDKSGDDGLFWMSWNDFTQHFEDIYICRVFKTINDGGNWYRYSARGSWKGITAGGCSNYPSTATHNPQYVVHINRPTTIFISLQQDEKDGRKGKKEGIGMILHDKEGYRVQNFYAKDEVLSSGYAVATEVTLEGSLTPSPSNKPYTLFVSTFSPNKELNYSLTIYTDTPLGNLSIEDGSSSSDTTNTTLKLLPPSTPGK